MEKDRNRLIHNLGDDMPDKCRTLTRDIQDKYVIPKSSVMLNDTSFFFNTST